MGLFKPCYSVAEAGAVVGFEFHEEAAHDPAEQDGDGSEDTAGPRSYQHPVRKSHSSLNLWCLVTNRAVDDDFDAVQFA